MKLTIWTGGRGENIILSPQWLFFFFLGNCQLVRNLFANLNVSSESTDVSPVPLNLHLWITRTSSECACIWLSECALVHLGIVLISLPYLSGQGSEFHTSVWTCEVGNLEIYRLGVCTTRLVLINELYYELNTINNIAWYSTWFESL